jgi:hypothetical protein
MHLVRFIYISSGNMKFWAKRICCWIYLYIFYHLWNGSTISSFYVQIVWKGGNFCALKEIFLIFMLWNYMHRDVVSFRIGLGLLQPDIVWKRWKISVLFKKFSWCECYKVICARILCHLALDLSPPNMIFCRNCFICIYADLCIKIKTSQIFLSLISRKSFFVSRPFVIQSFVFCEFYATMDLGI